MGFGDYFQPVRRFLRILRGLPTEDYSQPKGWNLSAATYDIVQPLTLYLLGTLGRLSYRAFAEELVRRAHLRQGDNVLDVACGTGYLIPVLYRAVGSTGTIEAVDFSPEMIARARRKAARYRINCVNLHVARVEELTKLFQLGQFDAVLCSAALPLFPNLEVALSQMYNVLKSEGHLVLSTASREDLSRARFKSYWRRAIEKHHLNYPTQEELSAMLLDAGFTHHVFDKIGLTLIITAAKPETI